MPEVAVPPQRSEPVRIRRMRIGFNVVTQLVATVLILGMLNYLGFKHYQRWDFSRNQKFALSDQTKRLLRTLKKPVKVIVFFSSSELSRDVENLLKEYAEASRKKLEFEFVDPYRNIAHARDLQSQYKFGANDNVIILDYDDQHRFVNASDLADYDRSGEPYGQEAKISAFKGEEAITSALMELTAKRQTLVYLLGGHGESDSGDDSLSTLKTFIGRQNIKVQPLNLMNIDTPPADANALVIVGAKYDLTERETKILHDYWTNKGRFFVLLDPTASVPRLTGFLNEIGIVPQEDRVLRTVPLGPVTGVLREVSANFVDGSPITKRLKGVNGVFGGLTESLQVDNLKAQEENIRHQPLIRAAEGFWGETEHAVREGGGVFFDPRKDNAPPLVLALSAEKGALDDARVRVDSSRLITVGNCTFVENAAITEANLDFFLSSLNWLLDREELIGIAPKSSQPFALNLTDRQMGNIALLTMVGMPAVAALCGVASWWRRRR